MVRVIMTPSAQTFVTPLTLSTLSRANVIIDPLRNLPGNGTTMLNLVPGQMQWFLPRLLPIPLERWLMVLQIISWLLPTSQRNARFSLLRQWISTCIIILPRKKISRILRSYGNTILEPQVGELASGLSGPGRMEEPENIISHLRFFFERQRDFNNKSSLLQQGRHIEAIDPVRLHRESFLRVDGIFNCRRSIPEGGQCYAYQWPYPVRSR